MKCLYCDRFFSHVRLVESELFVCVSENRMSDVEVPASSSWGELAGTSTHDRTDKRLKCFPLVNNTSPCRMMVVRLLGITPKPFANYVLICLEMKRDFLIIMQLQLHKQPNKQVSVKHRKKKNYCYKCLNVYIGCK